MLHNPLALDHDTVVRRNITINKTGWYADLGCTKIHQVPRMSLQWCDVQVYSDVAGLIEC